MRLSELSLLAWRNGCSALPDLGPFRTGSHDGRLWRKAVAGILGLTECASGRTISPPSQLICADSHGACVSTASWVSNSASWHRLTSSPDRGEAYCGSRERSIAGLPTSIPKPREEAARDRRNARLDAVAASRPFDICDVNPGDQTLTVWRAGGSTPTPVGAM